MLLRNHDKPDSLNVVDSADLSKPAERFSPEELIQFRKLFLERAERRRRYDRRCIITAILVFLVWFVSIRFLPPLGLGWICGVLFAAFVVLLISAWFREPHLECPACHRDLDSFKLGRFCPECGRDQVLIRRWTSPICKGCGATMRWGKGRRYTIRACTHCGVFFDQKGV
jgi:hypothetical protein